MELEANRVKAPVQTIAFAMAYRLFGGNPLAISKSGLSRGLAASRALTDLARQLGSFVGVGSRATSLHYLVRIALVQLGWMSAVPAALCGFAVGGFASYGLNRRHTFGSERPHREAVWRFALVAGVAFGLTFFAMKLLVERGGVPYLLAQAVTTLGVMVWTFAANRLWTFRGER